MWSWFDWSLINFWSYFFLFFLFSFTFGDTARAFFDEFNSMRSSGTIGTFDGDLSFNGLGGRAARALSFHLTVFVDSGGDTLTGTHVNFKVSFSFTQQTIDFNGDSSNKISGNGATANSWSWFSAFFDATIFRSIDEFFWALFEHDFSGGEAFGVDVSFALFTSALDAFVFTGRPAITDLSLFVVFVGAAQWNTHTATFSRVGNSDMTHWAITAAFGVTDWNEEAFDVWRTWATASSAWIASWRPEGAWFVGFSFELTEVFWNASSFDMTWATANNWGVNWSSAVWTRLKFWLVGTDAFDGILATTADVGVGDSLGNFSVSAWKFIRNWAIILVANTLVEVATSWSGWVIGSDQHWSTASIGASGLSWNWTRFLVANTFFFVDGGTASAWSFDVNFRSGDHLESSWTNGFLVIDWAFRRVTSASVLWATFSFRSAQDSAWSFTNWSSWAEFWFVDTNVVVTATHVFVTVDINSDWEFFNEASEFNGTVLNDWSSAVIWVADTLELWATVGFGGSFFTVSSTRGDNNGNFFTGNTVGFFVLFFGFSTSSGIAQAGLATTARISRFVKSFVFVADWISVVKWTRFDGALASSNWATFVRIVGVVSENFYFTKRAFITDWTFWAVFGDVFSTFDWFAPFFSAASGSIGSNSFDFELSAGNGFVSALNNFFNDHTWIVTSTGSFDTFVFLSTVVFIPEFTGSMFNTAFISANVAILWIDAFVSLENFTIFTEAALFDVFNKAPSFVESVKLVVFTSFWKSWSASFPLFIIIFTSFSWASHVVVLSVRVVWNDVFVSPVIDTVSGVTRTLLSEVVDLFATGVESFDNIETTLVLLTVQGERVVTSVQVVVWIGDSSAIVEVWVDVDSVTFIGQSGFTFAAWHVFWKTFWNLLAFVSWATSFTTFNSWDFNELVQVVLVFLGGTSFFRWFSAFFNVFTFTRFFEARAGSVLVWSPFVFLVSITSEIVSFWTIATAFSGIATTVKVIDSDFTFFAWLEVFNRSNTDRARFVSIRDPSQSTGTFDVFTRVSWVAFDGVDWFTIAVFRTTASFFLF